MKTRFEHFASWLATPLGHYLASCESQWFDRTVCDIFGYKAVQIELPQLDALRSNRMPWRLMAGHTEGVCLLCQAEAMPFDTQSIDLLVLPHGLDFAIDPHAVLREAERVLVPEGRLLITGFNPWSLWGLRRLKANDAPWRGNYITLPRIRDWLSLLDLQTRGGEFLCHRLPVQRPGWLEKTRFLDNAGETWWPAGGGVYCLDAVKRVKGMNIIEPAWRKVPVAKAGHAVAEKNVHKDTCNM